MPLLYLAQLLFQAKLCFLLNNFSAVVVTAVTANPVRHLILSALRAFHKGRSVKLPHVGTSFITTGFGSLFLRYCHSNIPPLVFRISKSYDKITHSIYYTTYFLSNQVFFQFSSQYFLFLRFRSEKTVNHPPWNRADV